MLLVFSAVNRSAPFGAAVMPYDWLFPAPLHPGTAAPSASAAAVESRNGDVTKKPRQERGWRHPDCAAHVDASRASSTCVYGKTLGSAGPLRGALRRTPGVSGAGRDASRPRFRAREPAPYLIVAAYDLIPYGADSDLDRA